MDTTLQDPLVGQLLDGRYRVDARIATGGMATVYRAVDTRLDRVLALKVMHTSLAGDAVFVERFMREAKSVARLSHPNVVAVYDQGADGAYVYLAMEYVAGCTLRDVLRDRGALSPRAALDILEPVLAALGAAHRAGFVHRDMKPENVLIGDDGRVKVADFGLVRAVNTVTSSTDTILGTVSYLAPEQIDSGTAEPRVDVYACGVLLYEMLTGAKPHDGDTPAQVLFRHLNEDMPLPSAVVPGLAPGLDPLVSTAAARDPEARPQDARELLAQVREARAALTAAQLDAVPPQAHGAEHDNAEDRTSVIPRIAPRPGPSAQTAAAEDELNRTSRLLLPPQPPVESAPAASVEPPDPRRRRLILVLVAAVVCALGLGVGVWYINSGQFTKVPPLLTKTEAQARDRIEAAGLEVGDIKRTYSDTDKRGTVMASSPEAGAKIRDNDEVDLTVSLGPENVKVPALEGVPLAKAKERLKQAGLKPGMVTKEFDDELAVGSVVSAEPGEGTKRRAGSAVALVVSRGPAIEVPDVTGESATDATSELQDLGLKVEISSTRVNSAFDAGQVADQNPATDAEVGEGDTITLILSKGPVMVEVPDVEGMKVDAAEQKLSDLGFQVHVDRGIFGIFDDEVSGQSVEAGEKAPKGSEITIKVE
ncbi:Stk1 family PASTA domain-containing Ser/Thr kinase [Streptomyces sp. NA04227]|uniref:Stk1 family PASTA domain-containing Ser/Thr kinase n=1 Tax=Streptomyces sp. NA04227 TaxID=2742136 RepID=UPI001591EED2|nr:Stk1 family PASTA domain-containing Ser/Thr kinase [Streptomyces sp. NA04227]QKW06018.1 Stk1 family PASTA domain-containing Ser/Thr kinase [Streptomyces sp. NA04227]